MENWRPQVSVDDESPWTRVVSWVKFVGPTRIVVSAVGVVVAAVIGWTLLRPSTPGAEATLGTLAPSSTTLDGSGSDSTSRSVVDAARDVVVHVAGSVVRPGVYELPVGSRFVDAVTAAGGPLTRAATDAVNLAAVLVDGERVYLPAVGERVEISQPAGAVSTSTVIDINSATAEQLDGLPGIGPSTAAAIVARRDEIGRFMNEDDLLTVPGIGPAKVAALRGLVDFSFG